MLRNIRIFIMTVLVFGCVMITGCSQKKADDTPFYYGTWDAGLKPGPMDGVRSETVTFTKDSVLTKQVIQGRGEVAMPSDVYKVISQNTD